MTASEAGARSTDNGFYQTNAADPVTGSDGTLFTTQGLVTVDGTLTSDTERRDALLCAEDAAGNRMYITNDDQYLYILVDLEQQAASPVYNLSFRNASSGTSYWMYF